MIWWVLGGSLAGLIAGSFLSTLVVRWPAGRTLGGRSACDACGRVLQPVELVPLLSALWLRLRCRSCGARIDPLHMRVELACGLVGGIALAVAPGPAGIAGALFGWLLVALAVLDARHFWLPDRLTGVLAVAGLASGVLGLAPSLADRLVGGVAGFGALWLVGFGYRRLRGREGLGGGDPKLFGAIGLWVGWAMLPFVLLGASTAGLLIVLGMIVARQPVGAATRLPLGSLLAIAAFPAWMYLARQG